MHYFSKIALLFFKAPKLWDSLPSNLKEAKNISTFKKMKRTISDDAFYYGIKSTETIIRILVASTTILIVPLLFLSLTLYFNLHAHVTMF